MHRTDWTLSLRCRARFRDEVQRIRVSQDFIYVPRISRKLEGSRGFIGITSEI